MPNLLKGFEACLQQFDLAELDDLDNVVYGVDAEWRLAYHNPAWERFAQDNGGEPDITLDWGLGRNLLDAIPSELLAFYRKSYTDCRRAGQPWHHDFECSSPSVYRRYQQTVYPLPNLQGLLIVNALVCEHPHPLAAQATQPFTDAVYTDDDAIVHQCCHCRRISNPSVPGRWDWVPVLVEKPSPRTSHTLCAACLDFYYPDDEPSQTNASPGEKQ